MWWCPSMMCLWEVTAAFNWWVSVLVSRAGWLALLPYSFLLSTDLRKITGRWQRLIRVFVPFTCCCRVILLHLPPLIMQQLWRKENQWLSLQSTKQLLGALSFSSLLLHLSDLWKGKGGVLYLQKDSSIALPAKVMSLWRLHLPDSPPCARWSVNTYRYQWACGICLPFLRALPNSFCFFPGAGPEGSLSMGIPAWFSLRVAGAGLPFVMSTI